MAKSKAGQQKQAAKRDDKRAAESKNPTAVAKATAPAAAPKSETDAERRARKNAYVRDWRKAHKDEYAKYLKAWRAKRDAKGGSAKPKAETSTQAQEKPRAKKGQHDERSGSAGAAYTEASPTPIAPETITAEVHPA